MERPPLPTTSIAPPRADQYLDTHEVYDLDPELEKDFERIETITDE